MRYEQPVLLLCCLMLLDSPARAQQSLSSSVIVTEDQQAVKLIHAALSALLGSTAAPPSTIVVSGTITPVWDSTATPHVVRVQVKDTDKFRWEEDFPQGTSAVVINGQNAQSKLDSTRSPLKQWEVAEKGLENFPILLLTSWLMSSDIEFHSVGLESVGEQNLHHISILDLSQTTRPLNPWHRDANRGRYELYIDPATSYPVQLRYYQETSDMNYFSLAPVDIVYSDFRVVRGSVYPFTSTRYRGEKKLAILQWVTIQPNGPVSDQDIQIW
jgi:hypothetical protein